MSFRNMAITVALCALAVFGASVASAATCSHSQPLRIGALPSGSLELRGRLEQQFFASLRDEGSLDGKNLIVERRHTEAEGANERLSAFASEVEGMKLDAVVTTCAVTTTAAMQLITTPPTVILALSDTVPNGLIASLAKPGRNVTGVSSRADELMPKMRELFARVLPRRATVPVPGNAVNGLHACRWNALSLAGQALELKLVRAEIHGRADLLGAFGTAAREGASAIFVLADDPILCNLCADSVAAATRRRLRDFHWSSEFVEAGGLMSYGESLSSSCRDGANHVAKLAPGARPEELSVAQPTHFELTLNLRTANALDVRVPGTSLRRPDRVIE